MGLRYGRHEPKCVRIPKRQRADRPRIIQKVSRRNLRKAPFDVSSLESGPKCLNSLL